MLLQFLVVGCDIGENFIIFPLHFSFKLRQTIRVVALRRTLVLMILKWCEAYAKTRKMMMEQHLPPSQLHQHPKLLPKKKHSIVHSMSHIVIGTLILPNGI